MYNFKTKNVLVSRDVNFYERCLPYRLSEADKTIMQNIFVPKSNFPTQMSDCLDQTQLEAQDTHESPLVFGSANENKSEFQDSDSSSTEDIQLHTTITGYTRPERTKRYPDYLKDYQCNFAKQAKWCNVISFCALSNIHKQTTKINAGYFEPNSYAKASTNPNWVEAMQKDIKALSENRTWEVVSLPHGKRPIECRWAYKVKLRSDDTLERLKARFGAKGFN